jgi:hypothetical protein
MSRLTYAAPYAVSQGALVTRTLGCGHISSVEAIVPNCSATGFQNTETNESTFGPNAGSQPG